MESPVINKKAVRSNRILRKNQKAARKYYGKDSLKSRYAGTKKRLRKLVKLENIDFISLVEEKVKECPMEQINREQLICECEKRGLSGRSGNGFPTADKLRSFQTKGGILLINGVECDPGLVHDAWLYRNKINSIETGVEILKKCFSLKKVILATKEPLINNHQAFEQVKVNDRYPMGYEKFLIQAVLDINLNQGELPSQKGILVLNIQTVVAIAEMFTYEKSKENRYLTFADMNQGRAIVVKAPIGMDAKTIISKVTSKLEMNLSNNTFYIGSGALSCHRLSEQDCITERTNYIGIGNMPDYANSSKCKKCGGCTRHCPMGVDVAKIVQYVENSGKANAKKCAVFSPDKCIECGLCTYNCLAGKDIREIVVWAKQGN